MSQPSTPNDCVVNAFAVELLDASQLNVNRLAAAAAAADDDDDDDDDANNGAEVMPGDGGVESPRRDFGVVADDVTAEGSPSLCSFTPRTRVLLASALAAVGGVLFGYDTGTPMIMITTDRMRQKSPALL